MFALKRAIVEKVNEKGDLTKDFLCKMLQLLEDMGV